MPFFLKQKNRECRAQDRTWRNRGLTTTNQILVEKFTLSAQRFGYQ
jgi:hypothetical protein